MKINDYDLPSAPNKFYQDRGWRNWRDFLGGGRQPQRSVEEWREIALDLAAQNNGKLPPNRTMRRMGYHSLSAIMSRYPAKFDDIPRDRLMRSKACAVREAEEAAEKNGGLLPPTGDLEKLGHKSLSQMIRKTPGLFSHIPKAPKRRMTVEDHVAEFKRLANDLGHPPSTSWIRKNRPSMRLAIRRHPHLFRRTAV